MVGLMYSQYVGKDFLMAQSVGDGLDGFIGIATSCYLNEVFLQIGQFLKLHQSKFSQVPVFYKESNLFLTYDLEQSYALARFIIPFYSKSFSCMRPLSLRNGPFRQFRSKDQSAAQSSAKVAKAFLPIESAKFSSLETAEGNAPDEIPLGSKKHD